jgi:hypothetical protein
VKICRPRFVKKVKSVDNSMSKNQPASSNDEKCGFVDGDKKFRC